MSEQVEHELTDAIGGAEAIGAGGALEDDAPPAAREPAPAAPVGQPAAPASTSPSSRAAGSTLPDSAELELRERMTVLEQQHNRAVGAIRFAQLLGLGAILFAVGLLFVLKRLEGVE